MKAVVVLGLLCGLMVGCANEDSKEETIETPEQSLQISTTLNDAMCNNAEHGNYQYKIHNRSVDLQIDNTIHPSLVELHLKAFDFWGIKINSVSYTGPYEPHDPSRYGLSICNRREIESVAFFHGAGTGLNYLDRWYFVNESVRQTIFIHEIGHCVGLPDVGYPNSLMNGSAGFAGVTDITPEERAQAESLLNGE